MIKEADFNKYLRKNPAPKLAVTEFSEAVVIPAYDEFEELPATLQSIKAAGFKGAIIVVINYPVKADPTSSEKLFSLLKNRDDLQLIWAPELAGGVGAARKLGMDAFIATRTMKNISSSVIYSLDADSPVAPKYFQIVSAQFPREQWVTINFSHRTSPETLNAITYYEAYLRRYAKKLQLCGSPYGFITLGSAFAVRTDAYIRAGGMRVRSAGEDFYFLQALAKLAPGKHLEEILVYPSSRPSHRVGFGTGPAVRKLIEGKDLPEIPDYAFEELAKLLNTLDPNEPQSWCINHPFFQQEGFAKVWPGILRNTPQDPISIRRAFDNWFDGLKTLRFLHFISDKNSYKS